MGLAGSAEWYTRWCEPIVWALYMKDTDEIHRAINAAHQAIDDDIVSETYRYCLIYQLAYLEFQAQRHLGKPNWQSAETLEPFLKILTEPCADPGCDALRMRLYIQLRLRLDYGQQVVLDPLELKRLLDQLPDQEKTIELWRYISSWAFKRNQADILKEAYECAVLNAVGFQREWTWYRVDLMWKLVNGTATTDNIKWVVKSAQIPGHIESLQGEILKRARDMGLVDDTLEKYIEARSLELAESEETKVTELLIDHTQNKDIKKRARHTQDGHA